jgi:hypothetical protein
MDEAGSIGWRQVAKRYREYKKREFARITTTGQVGGGSIPHHFRLAERCPD